MRRASGEGRTWPATKLQNEATTRETMTEIRRRGRLGATAEDMATTVGGGEYRMGWRRGSPVEVGEADEEREEEKGRRGEAGVSTRALPSVHSEYPLRSDFEAFGQQVQGRLSTIHARSNIREKNESILFFSFLFSAYYSSCPSHLCARRNISSSVEYTVVGGVAEASVGDRHFSLRREEKAPDCKEAVGSRPPFSRTTAAEKEEEAQGKGERKGRDRTSRGRTSRRRRGTELLQLVPLSPPAQLPTLDLSSTVHLLPPLPPRPRATHTLPRLVLGEDIALISNSTPASPKHWDVRWTLPAVSPPSPTTPLPSCFRLLSPSPRPSTPHPTHANRGP